MKSSLQIIIQMIKPDGTLDKGRCGGCRQNIQKLCEENRSWYSGMKGLHRGLESIAIHLFNWIHQAQEFRHLKKNLKENEMVLCVDFSDFRNRQERQM